jgi:hypothetical protein
MRSTLLTGDAGQHEWHGRVGGSTVTKRVRQVRKIAAVSLQIDYADATVTAGHREEPIECTHLRTPS